jgi:hypothetical protein
MRMICDRLYGTLQSLYRLLPEHIVAAALSEKKTVTKAECIDGVRRALVMARDGKRNLKTLDPMTEEQVLSAGLKQLCHVKAIRLRGAVIGVKNRMIVDYYAAALLP